jgi:hypothetical protein
VVKTIPKLEIAAKTGEPRQALEKFGLLGIQKTNFKQALRKKYLQCILGEIAQMRNIASLLGMRLPGWRNW